MNPTTSKVFWLGSEPAGWANESGLGNQILLTYIVYLSHTRTLQETDIQGETLWNGTQR